MRPSIWEREWEVAPPKKEDCYIIEEHTYKIHDKITGQTYTKHSVTIDNSLEFDEWLMKYYYPKPDSTWEPY